jgi:alkaline phosphatase D
MTSPVFTSSQAVDAQGVAKVSISNRTASTRYWWQVEDNSVLDTSVTGQFLTHPLLGLPTGFTIGFASCAGTTPDFPGDAGGELAADRLSNSPVFDTIRQQAIDDDWLEFVSMGDKDYYDLGSNLHGIVGGGSLANYRASYDDVLAQTNQAGLYREVALSYVWDDHDYGPNNSDGTHVDKANVATVYRERVPHNPLPDSDSIYQNFQVGRILFVLLDSRFERSPNSDLDNDNKTMLGAAQKAWLENLLDTTSAEFLVLVSPSVWLASSGSDTWASFSTERDALVAMLLEKNWLHRMCMVFGDRHAIGIESGAHNQWGGFPVLMAASLDSSPSEGDLGGGTFDVLPSTGGRGQYGTLTVVDIGSSIQITMTAWKDGVELGSHSFGITLQAGPTAVATISEAITGPHRAVFEARIVEEFQTGDDPDGTIIPLIDGSVSFNGDDDIFGSANVVTKGFDDILQGMFPRSHRDLLSPYGNEVFLRRGVDVGSHIIWVPLGYFTLYTPSQSPSSDSDIAIDCLDRMAGIVDGWLINPVMFRPNQTYDTVVRELVADIYPDAAITFDDSSGQQKIGRQIIVERDRYAIIREIADSLAKIVYFDGEGVLRFEDIPDDDDVTWEIKGGANGAHAEMSRHVTRRGMANGVVVTGEGTTSLPTRGVAVDLGPNSPTRWGGRFGKVPFPYSSPLFATNEQCRKAAVTLLRKRIGMPYQINFGSVTNPALRPYQLGRIQQEDGTREKHRIQSCTIPLISNRNMTGSTKQQLDVSIGDLP